MSWFRRKKPVVVENPEWVMNAIERKLTVARLTGKYPPHPPGRGAGRRLNNEQIR